eukprot:981917-Alexandrium_andersonii.AAC.1
MTQQWGDDRWAFAFVAMSVYLHGPVRRQRLRARLDRYFASQKLPFTRGIVCKIPFKCALTLCRRTASDVFRP